MLGFRFSLVLDFGVGAAAMVGPGVGRRENSAQRMEKGWRLAVSPLPKDLGWGPLEPENADRRFGEPKRTRGTRQ